MSEQQYDIIFRGDIVLGHQLVEVKLRLQQLFKADAAKIDSLFSGRPVPLKRGLDLISAQKYQDALIKAGAQVELLSTVDITSVAPIINKPVDPAPAVSVPAAHKPTTHKIAEQPVATTQTEKNFSLAPVGSNLLQAKEKPPVVQNLIDISALSVRLEGGNLLDANEQKPSVAPIKAPEFKLAEVGADLIRSEDKQTATLVEVEAGDWNIAEVGANLINADEKEIAALPVINIPNVDLAPAGADLGQIKPIIKPVVPDISKLRLAD